MSPRPAKKSVRPAQDRAASARKKALTAALGAALDSTDADVQHRMAGALSALGMLDEAARHYREAIRLKADHVDAHLELGRTLITRGRIDEAGEMLEAGLQHAPDDLDLLSELVQVRTQQRRFADAAALATLMTTIEPHAPSAHVERGYALLELGRFDEAIAAMETATRLAPHVPAHRYAHAVVLNMMGRAEESAALSRTLLLRHPDDPNTPHVRFNLAVSLLKAGDYENGWPAYEARWQDTTQFPRRPFRQPEWDGRPLRGRRILIYSEQGLGDKLQFIRYAALVKQRGGYVIIVCQKDLCPLLATCPGVDEAIPAGEVVPRFDVHASLMSLPAILGTTLTTVPAQVPYLFPDEGAVSRWRKRLGGDAVFKIGVVWQGNKNHDMDAHRSFALQKLAPLARVPGVKLYSLQKGAGSEQMAAVDFAVHDLGDDLDRGGMFVDTTAIMKSLDLVVAPDSSLAHLAGALGVPIWLAVSVMSDFRWLLERHDTPWYPSMRLFRQEKLDAWTPVFERMATALAVCVRERA